MKRIVGFLLALTCAVLLATAPAHAETVKFDCNWDNGSDELNTGACADENCLNGNDVWDVLGDSGNLLGRTGPAATFNNSAGAMWVSGNSTARVQEDFTATATAAERNWLKVIVEGLADGESVPLVSFYYVGVSLAEVAAIMERPPKGIVSGRQYTICQPHDICLCNIR